MQLCTAKEKASEEQKLDGLATATQVGDSQACTVVVAQQRMSRTREPDKLSTCSIHAQQLYARGTNPGVIQHITVCCQTIAVTIGWYTDLDHAITGQSSFIPGCEVDKICTATLH